MTRCLAGTLALVGVFAASPPSRADEPKGAAKDQSPPPASPSAADVSKADALFRKARLLKKLGKEAEACPLFVESQSLDPNGGTLVNIAECHESEGKTGTAWRELLSALKLAKQTENKDLVKGIRDKLAAIVPRLYQITIQIPKEVSGIPGVAIHLDDRGLTTDVPSHFEVVDPGRHTVHGWAPGYVDFDKTVAITEGQRSVIVRVALEKPPPPPPPDHTFAWGLVGGGSGATLLGGGLLIAATQTTGVDQIGFAIGGTGLLALGFVGGITGAVLRATASPPSSPAPTITRSKAPRTTFAVSPILAPGTAFVSVSGTF